MNRTIVAPSGRSYDIGTQFSKQVAFDREGAQKFAALAGDFNPLHHDEEAARRSRFGALIASGTQTSSVMMGVVASALCGFGPGAGLDFTIRLKKPVYVDQQTTIVWRLTAVARMPGVKGDVLSFEGELRNAAGEVAVQAKTRGIVFDES